VDTGPASRPFGLRILGSPDEPSRLTRLRVQVLLTISIVTWNLGGVAAVFLLAAFVIPGAPKLADAPRVAVLNIIGGAVYTGVALIVGIKLGTRLVSRKAGWLRSERPPNEAEQRFVLQIPLILTGVQAALWLPAAAVFAVFNAVLGDHLSVQIALTVLLGGLLTCSNSYVVSELIARPLAARALAGGPPSRSRVPGVLTRAVLAWLLGSAVPVAGLMAVAVVALTRPAITTTRLALTVLVLGGIMLALGLRITWMAARANSDPIKSLRHAVDRVEHGDFDVSVPIYDGTEIGLLQAGFNRMAAGLREREHIRDVFGRHVGEDVARTALEELEGEAALGGVNCEVGVLFVDIIGSTALTISRSPSEVVDMLNRFFAVVVDVALNHGGLVNKFEGDGALVVFGAPVPVPNPAAASLAAGRELAARLATETPDFEAAIGIGAGNAVAGNIGAQARYEYTVIGDAVNEAARLTDLAKGLPGRIVASESAVRAAGPPESDQWTLGDEVALRGRPTPTRIATPVVASLRS
jgi:adenylate cyclase